MPKCSFFFCLSAIELLKNHHWASLQLTPNLQVRGSWGPLDFSGKMVRKNVCLSTRQRSLNHSNSLYLYSTNSQKSNLMTLSKLSQSTPHSLINVFTGTQAFYHEQHLGTVVRNLEQNRTQWCPVIWPVGTHIHTLVPEVAHQEQPFTHTHWWKSHQEPFGIQCLAHGCFDMSDCRGPESNWPCGWPLYCQSHIHPHALYTVSTVGLNSANYLTYKLKNLTGYGDISVILTEPSLLSLLSMWLKQPTKLKSNSQTSGKGTFSVKKKKKM